MKIHRNPKLLKLLILGSGILGLVLRIVFYATGVDGRGLLVSNHPAVIALWCLTAAVAAVLLVFSFKITGSAEYAEAYPVSIPAALGAFAAMTGMAFATGREFAEFSNRLNLIVWVLGICSMAAMGRVGLCRLTGKKPYFLLHVVVCIYFAMRMVSQYRAWSADPCLQDYCFYLCAYVALMLAAYHQAAFDAGVGKHRGLWFCSLAAVYLCCLSLKGSSDSLLLLGSAAWAFTNLTRVDFKVPDKQGA
ncbi:MAG: hypothetical protein IKT52_05390 [Oscillospiraceae bacterium]|nr:hypothetical protein [Oscillospiraceae bacterium]